MDGRDNLTKQAPGMIGGERGRVRGSWQPLDFWLAQPSIFKVLIRQECHTDLVVLVMEEGI